MNNSSQGDPLATKEPVGTEDDVVGQRERSSTPSRAEAAAEQIAELARSAAPGTRLGSREELRALCGVSVGTLHEALRLLQSTSKIFVRPGHGGGVLAAESSRVSDLLCNVTGQPTDTDQFHPLAS